MNESTYYTQTLNAIVAAPFRLINTAPNNNTTQNQMEKMGGGTFSLFPLPH